MLIHMFGLLTVNNYHIRIFLTIKKRVDVLYLMEEVFVNHIFNSPDIQLFVCYCGEVTVIWVSFLELVVLWLEVFSINMWWSMAVQKLAL